MNVIKRLPLVFAVLVAICGFFTIASYAFVGFWGSSTGSAPAQTGGGGGGGGSLVCDQGPNATAVPTQAQRAGFTRCALNADFTTANWSNPATYIVNCGASASVSNQPSTWHFYNNKQFTSTHRNCNETVIVSDGGSPALRITYPSATWDNTFTEFGWPNEDFQAGSSNRAWLPNEVYVEITWRIASVASWNQANTPGNYGWFDWWWEYEFDPPLPNPSTWVEPDFQEALEGRSAGANGRTWYGQLIDWETNGTFYSQDTEAAQDLTQYHKWGFLTTSDESTNIWKCTLMDDVFQGCHFKTQASAVNYIQHDNVLSLQLGTTGNNVAPTTDIQVFVRSISMWMCPNYVTQTCPGTMITGP